MHSKRNIIGLSAAVIVVLLLVTITSQQSTTSSFPELTAALARGVKAGSTRKSVRAPLKPSAASSTSSSAAVTPLSLPAFGFAISYPTSWQAKKEPGGGAMNVYLTSEEDSFIMTVTLVTNTEKKAVKLDALVSATIAAMPSELQFKVVKTENGKLAGAPTKVLAVTQKADDGTLLKGQQVFLIKGKTLCVFFFTNTPEKYDQALQLFNNTLKTVTLR